MAVNGILVCAFVAGLLVSGLASPHRSNSDRDAKGGGLLPQFLIRGETVRDNEDSVARQQRAVRTRVARMERLAHLTEDEREIMTKQIMQAISEMANSGCMSDRDYQGWVDFGRRNTD